MIEGIIPLLVSIATILSVLINAWLAGKPKRAEDKRNEEIQKGRTALTDGDVDAVERRLDNILRDEVGCSDAGGKDATGEDGSTRPL